MIIPVLCDTSISAKDYFSICAGRADEMVYPVFTMDFKDFKAGKDDRLFLVHVKMNVPRVYFLGIIPIILAFVFKSPLLLVLGVLVWSMSVFYTPLFFYLVLWRGIRKHGYRGKLRLLDPAKGLEFVVKNGGK